MRKKNVYVLQSRILWVCRWTRPCLLSLLSPLQLGRPKNSNSVFMLALVKLVLSLYCEIHNQRVSVDFRTWLPWHPGQLGKVRLYSITECIILWDADQYISATILQILIDTCVERVPNSKEDLIQRDLQVHLDWF